MSYYAELGIPTEAVHLYLMTIANTNFEQWYDQNKDKTLDDFKFDFKKISSSGALFDLEKLINISRNYISYLKAEDVYERVLEWSKVYDNELFEILSNFSKSNNAPDDDIFLGENLKSKNVLSGLAVCHSS